MSATDRPWKLVLLLAGIFLAGMVSGALVMIRIGREMAVRRPLPGQWAPQQMRRLAERLSLSPEQQETLRPIVRRNMQDLARVRNYTFQETGSILERMEREISDKLTPEQRGKFEQMNKEWRERLRRQFGPGGGMRGRHGEPPIGPPSGPPPEKPADKPPGG